MINTDTIPTGKVKDCLLSLAKTKFPAMLMGKPGIGKTDTIKQIVKILDAKGKINDPDYSFGLITCLLSQLESSDLRGLPKVTDTCTKWFQPDFLPKEGEGILFLDDITNAPNRVQVAAYQLLLDRELGDYKLPDGWWVCAAGNRIEDNTGSSDVNSALADRLVFLNIECSSDDWLDWAATNSINPGILSYIKTKPDCLDSIQGQDMEDKVIRPTPRSWERVSTILDQGFETQISKTLISGIIGREISFDFFETLNECRDLPTAKELLEMSKQDFKERVPKKLSALYTVVYSLLPFAVDRTKEVFLKFLLLPEVDNDLPGKEILTLGVELLIGKVSSNPKIINELLLCEEFDSYMEQVNNERI